MASEKFDFSEFLGVLEAKRDALDALITSYRNAMSLGALGQPGEGVSVGDMVSASLGASGGTSSAAGFLTSEIPHGAFMGKKIPEAIMDYLGFSRRKQTTKDIAEALRQGGLESTSKHFPVIVTSALHRLKGNGDVLKFSDGWALASLYPDSLRARIAAKEQPQRKKRRKGAPKLLAAPSSES